MKNVIITLGLLFFVIFSSCHKDEEPSSSVITIVIPKEVKVIKNESWDGNYVSLDSSNYSITFSNSISSAKDIKVGDVLVSGAGEGLLRKVTSVSSVNNGIKVQTESAVITDAISKGVIEFNQALTTANIQSIDYHYKGIMLNTDKSKGLDETMSNFDINTVIYDNDGNHNTTSDQIRLQGAFSFDWHLEALINVNLSGITEAKFGLESNENLDLQLITGLQYSFSKEISLATIKFTPIYVQIGPLPVVFVPQVDIFVGIDGSANASITSEINQSLSFNAGIKYLKASGWSSYKTFDKNFTFVPPHLNMNASAGAYIKPEFIVKVYGITGPYFNMKLYGRLDANLLQSPWWKLYGGMSMDAGVKVNVLDKFLLECTVKDLLNYEQVLGQATAPPYVVPTLTTSSISSITQSTATGGGNISSDGGASVTLRGICWSTSQNPTTANSITSNGTGIGNFTSNLTGLSAGTTYFVRAYATNNAGTAYGSQTSFTTTPNVTLPTLTTTAITSITQTTATGGGNITNDGGATVTARGVCWSTSQNPTIANIITFNGTGIGNFTSNLTGLSAGTTYYVRAYATNSAGTAYGSQTSFTTSTNVGLPTLNTIAITSITQTTATGGGNITNDGGATVTVRGVCWNTSQNPTIANSITSNGTGIGNFTSNLTGLSAGTTYYVRAYATNSAGTAYGSQTSFATSPNTTLPSLTTSSITSITQISATGGGNITVDGGTTVTTRGVCWSTSQNPTTSNSFTNDGTGIGNFTSNLTGLSAGTTYYVRAYATNSAGTAYGSQTSFTTSPNVSLPTLTTSTITSITQTTATGGGNITSDGGTTLTGRGVCWSTSQNPTTSNSITTDGTGIGNFTSNLTGLSAGTTYYVRAYATNSAGTAYGSQTSFTTSSNVTLPTLTTSTITSITQTTATGGGNITSDGGTTLTGRGVCWSTSQNPTTSNSITTDGTGIGNFTSNLTGLSAGTTYYVRAYATNSAGTAYGSQTSFTTSSNVSLPTLTTSSITSITQTTATGGGNITSDGGATVTARGICWSISQNPTIANNMTYNGSGTGSFTSTVSGLSANTTYYVRAYATNSAGTAYGSQTSFTTSPNVSMPTLTTSAISSITQTTAMGGGNISSDGGATVTSRGICWSVSQNPTILNSMTNNGSGTGSFTSTITGLSANTIYYVRAYATNSAGTAYGSQTSFATSPNVSLPTLTTSSITSITQTTATGGGNITSDGGATVTSRGICWSVTQNPTILNSMAYNGSGTGSFTSTITGLSANTTYYVRAYATNSEGTVYGAQVSFTTLSGPQIHWQVNPSDAWIEMTPNSVKSFAGSTWTYLGDNSTYATMTRNSGSPFRVNFYDFTAFDNNAIIIIGESDYGAGNAGISFGTSGSPLVAFDQTNKVCQAGQNVTFVCTTIGTTFNFTSPDIYRASNVSLWNQDLIHDSSTQERYIFSVPASATPGVYEFYIGVRVGGPNGRDVSKLSITVTN